MGFVGLVVGMSIGGSSIGFFAFGPATGGYEAGGPFCALVGIALGSFFAVTLFQKCTQRTGSYVAALLAAGVSFAVDSMIYVVYVPEVWPPFWATVLILLIPPCLLVVVGVHFEEIVAFARRTRT